jgi:hypothetical protein
MSKKKLVDYPRPKWKKGMKEEINQRAAPTLRIASVTCFSFRIPSIDSIS